MREYSQAVHGYRSGIPDDLAKAGDMAGRHVTETGATPARDTVLTSGQRLFTFVEFGPLPVISLRHSGTFRTLARTWRNLIDYADSCGLIQGIQLVGVVYDDPAYVPAESLRYDACVAVPEAGLRRLPLPADSGLPVRYETLGPVWCWRTTHRGRFGTLSETYRRALDTTAFQQQGVVAPCLNPPFYEIYRSGLGAAQDDDARIDIHLPVG